jgi:hypothetical protein
MHDLIQSAKDAASHGDKSKALDLLKEALSSNPNDIDALLAFASLVDEPTRKRQIVNRVLSLDAVNRPARDMLLEMDRAELNSYRAPLASTPVPASAQPAAPLPKPGAKPQVFRYSTAWLVVLYLFTTMFCCLGLFSASQSVSSAIPTLGLAFLFGISALSVSSKVEVTEAGIRSSSWLGGSEIKWNEIARLNSNSWKRSLELISDQGRTVRVSTQVKGYGAIVELLRQKRPDLFGQGSSGAATPDSSGGPAQLSPSGAVVFTETRTFQKGFLKQYGLLFVLVPLFLLFIWMSFASADSRLAFLVTAGVCALLMLIPFFQVAGLKVEPNQLTIQSFFEEKVLSASQVREIKMQSVRGRYGRVTNFVNIIPVEGKKYALVGFAEGEELLYGFLMNWWSAYQRR